MAATTPLRRLAFGACIVTGVGLVGSAAYGVSALDGPLADAAQRQQRLQQQQSEQVVRVGRERPCPHRFRAPAQRSTSVTL